MNIIEAFNIMSPYNLAGLRALDSGLGLRRSNWPKGQYIEYDGWSMGFHGGVKELHYNDIVQIDWEIYTGKD